MPQRIAEAKRKFVIWDVGLGAAANVVAVLDAAAKHHAKVQIVSFEGLVVDFARKNDVNFLVRGLRAFSDFEQEFRMALVNRQLSGIETIFLMSDANFSHIRYPCV